jgi:hypothetical protein
MTAALHHAAAAALPVAIGLLAVTAAARAALWADHGERRLGDLAHEHLGPLSTWCLIADAVHTAALGAAGEAGVGSLGLALAIGAAAAVLRAPAEERAEPAASGDGAAWSAAPAPASPKDAVHARRTAGARSLWAEPAAEAEARTGLWSR